LLDQEKVILAIRKNKSISNYEEKIDIGISMLYFESIVKQTLMNVDWKFEKTDKNYNIPDNFKIVGYCNI